MITNILIFSNITRVVCRQRDQLFFFLCITQRFKASCFRASTCTILVIAIMKSFFSSK
ncbi:hypothetical protein X975_12499, partial [Stegodyphus mimosarum]